MYLSWRWSWSYISFLKWQSADPNDRVLHVYRAAERREDQTFTVQPANGVYRIVGEYNEEQTVSNDNSLSVLGNTQASSTRFSTIILPNDSTLSEVTSLASAEGVKTTIEEDPTAAFVIAFG